jgi:hypothetical protein
VSRSSRFFSLVDFHFSCPALRFESFLCLSAGTVGFAVPTLLGDDTKPSKSVYAKGRQRAEQLFEEIEEWKEDGDFRSVGFDPVGPFFRWQLQAKKLEKTLNAEPGSSDGETNLGALSAAVAELIKLGDEYAENEGNVTKRTRKASAYIEDVLDSLTDEPDGEPSRLMASDGMAEEDEPNPFEEEGSAPSKTRKKAGPKSRKPQVDESDEENPAKYTTDRKSRRNSGGLIPLLGSLTEQDDGEVSHDESSVITYDQFKQVKMGMTKEEVFEVLGKGVKVSMPIVDALVGMRLEAYLWENEDEFGGCEITFADGKVEHKIWNGPVPQDEEEDEDMSEKKSGRKTDKK